MITRYIPISANLPTSNTKIQARTRTRTIYTNKNTPASSYAQSLLYPSPLIKRRERPPPYSSNLVYQKIYSQQPADRSACSSRTLTPLPISLVLTPSPLITHHAPKTSSASSSQHYSTFAQARRHSHLRPPSRALSPLISSAPQSSGGASPSFLLLEPPRHHHHHEGSPEFLRRW